MIRLVYRSVSLLSAPDGVPVRALGDLLEGCLERNAAVGVTGVLAFDGTHFIQVLEGPVAIVDGLFTRIGHDPRHAGIELLARESAERLFATWSMALVYRDPRLPTLFGRVAAQPMPVAGRVAAKMLAALVA